MATTLADTNLNALLPTVGADLTDEGPDWWTEAKKQVRADLADLLAQFDQLTDPAPEAWSQMRWVILNSLHSLEDGYRRHVHMPEDE